MSPDRALLQRELLGWYAAARRELPWRQSRDPYAIWLSEVMLQQTRVEVVIDYWRRFLARFPTLVELATASEDEVLVLWSGLGYYRRARMLLAAARQVVQEHDGRLPADHAALLALPGFGPYTAGAVASIAFGIAVPLVDGNVARVLTRLYAIEGVPTSGPTKRRLWELAAELVVEERPGDWNQALMELGARVCRPQRPDCVACPLAAHCRARAEARTAELPHKAPPRTYLDVELEALVVRFPGGLLLTRRPEGGRNPGLFEVPTREVSRPHAELWATDWPSSELARHFESALPVGCFRHAITHHRIRVEARRFDCKPASAARIAAASAYDLVPHGRLAELALSGLTAKLLHAT